MDNSLFVKLCLIYNSIENHNFKVVDSMSILGVTITSDLKAEQHLSRILSSAQARS